MKAKLIAGLGVLGLCAALYPISVYGREGGLGGLPSFVSYGKQVLLLGEPEAVASGKTVMAAWSPDSQSVIALRQSRSGKIGTPQEVSEVSLVLWDAVTRRSREIWRKQIELTVRDGSLSPQWLPKSGIAVVTLSWHTNPDPITGGSRSTRGALWIDTVRGTASEIALGSEMGQIVVSPTQPLAVVVHEDSPPLTDRDDPLHIINRVIPLLANGTPGKASANLENHYFSGWTPDGKQLIFAGFNNRVINKEGVSSLAPLPSFATVNPATSAIVYSEKEPEKFKEVPVAPSSSRLSLRETTAKIQEGKTAHTVHPVWLESKGKKSVTRALLTANGRVGSISPNGKNALYFSQGAAWIVALRPTPRAEYAAMARLTLLSNARQAGLALSMYLQDYDEIFPPSDDNFVEIVNLYLLNREVLEGLTYSRPGNGLADIDKPAETIMGTVSGPGGQVVVYADGHAKWIPDPNSGGDDDDD